MDTRTGKLYDMSEEDYNYLVRKRMEAFEKSAYDELEKDASEKVSMLESDLVPVERSLSNTEKKKKRIKPNSYCVCGSGKRFKNCCRTT